MTLGETLRSLSNQHRVSERQKILEAKHYLNDSVNLPFMLMELAEQGDTATVMRAVELLNGKYHDTLMLDMRSSAKKALVKEVVELLTLKLDGVQVSWLGRASIQFSWW